MRYDQLYSIRAQKAVESGLVDVTGFVDELLASGVPIDRVNDLLIQDLESDGPIFGKFFRSLGMAGEATISVAQSQSAAAAEAIELESDIVDLRKGVDIR